MTTWVEGTVDVYCASKDADLATPALQTIDHIARIYFGVHDGRAVFGYRAPDLTVEDVIFFATRHLAESNTAVVGPVTAGRDAIRRPDRPPVTLR
jgi:hypothetical protein